MNWLDRKIDEFIRRIRDTKPNIPVGPLEDPTYIRYFVIKRNRWLNLYLHHWRHDDAQHHHDHRAHNLSIILQGSYSEERFVRRPRQGQPLPETYQVQLSKWRPKFRLASTPHRVLLNRNSDGVLVHAWSLFIKLPDIRDWGFWVNVGSPSNVALWIPWRSYTAGDDPEGVGYGKPRPEFRQ